ncbi:hypothetical protein [Halalkalibacter krulwichiae]|uniref:Uncharacterized protein n=1 Tax=Halalkalibacter krulwichiae TaxID=199441 RepID=A0A1X9M7V0_9BACI|nr:hypothetical protein [Halalkalibacter krulwichiae]ARK28754.1 hypothetical protein BkAM31D_02205 [Halalkalibacter krulwichiae]
MNYSIYYRTFFVCRDCDFKFSLLGAQAKYEVEGYCPCCEGDIDYLSVKGIEKYLKGLKGELAYM